MSTPANRNLQLDFFRGIALLIIFIGHSIGNPAANWMPRNFGFSDAAEIFVFCSGLACAYAFGPLFAAEHFWRTTARIAYRCWQIYWVHIALAFSVIALMVSFEEAFGHMRSFDDYDVFFAKTQIALPALMTLQWLPAYLDILPLYLVLMACIPLMMVLRRLHPALPLIASIGLYAVVWMFDLHVMGSVPVEARWFFNPYAWQLLFFTGYFIGMGWVKIPRFGNRTLMAAAAAFIILSVPLSWHEIYAAYPWMMEWRDMFLTGWHKHNLNLLRYVHFLALSYLMISLLSLRQSVFQHRFAQPIIVTGRQVLASFVAGIFIARFVTIAYETAPDYQLLLSFASTLGGCALVVLAAYVKQFFKNLGKKKPVFQALSS